MLTPEELTKMAMEPVLPSNVESDPRSTARKIVDTLTNGATAVSGAVLGGIAGLNSLDKHAPVKNIQ